MENKLKWIYNNGTVRAEKYPEPAGDFYTETGHNFHIYASDLKEWQSYESANIAEADKPYWEIKVAPAFYDEEGKPMYDLIVPNAEVTIDRIENNKAVIV